MGCYVERMMRRTEKNIHVQIGLELQHFVVWRENFFLLQIYPIMFKNV